MKAIQHLCYAVLVVLCMAVAGCKKDSNTAASPTKLLTGGPWKQTKDEWLQTVTGAWIDQTNGGKIALTSAVLTFLDNNTWSVNGGSFGTWNLSSDNKQLTMFSSNGTSVSVTVASVSSTTLELTSPLTNAYTINKTDPNLPYQVFYSTERDTYSH